MILKNAAKVTYVKNPFTAEAEASRGTDTELMVALVTPEQDSVWLPDIV